MSKRWGPPHYFAAGVSFRTGKQLDVHADKLNHLLFTAEQAIEQRDSDAAISSVTEFAQIVLTIPPFAPKDLPANWEGVLHDWMSGRPMAEIVSRDPEQLVEFVEDAIVYRLVWAVEAIRVRSQAHQDVYSALWTGRLAGALEAGTMDRSAVILVHAGLGSRVAALAALNDFPGDFEDYEGMKGWLTSKPVVDAGRVKDWPTKDTADLWHSFVDSTYGESTRVWKVQSKTCRVKWKEGVPQPGDELVRVLKRGSSARAEVYTPDFVHLGELREVLPTLLGVVYGRVVPAGDEIELMYHGPDKLK